MRTLFGALPLGSPRWWHCPCQARASRNNQPALPPLRERTTPELSYLQTRFAALVSYGLSADMLNKILPLGRVLHTTTVRRQVQATAQRLENELPILICRCPRATRSGPRSGAALRSGGGKLHPVGGCSCVQLAERVMARSLVCAVSGSSRHFSPIASIARNQGSRRRLWARVGAGGAGRLTSQRGATPARLRAHSEVLRDRGPLPTSRERASSSGGCLRCTAGRRRSD